MDLKEWTIHYVKYKDMVTRSLVNHKEDKNGILFQYKDKEQYYLISETITDNAINLLKDKSYKTIVCLYAPQNMEYIIKHWQILIALKNFWILFSDPNKDKKLLLNPYSHNFIADPETLEDGLWALFDPEKAALKPEKKEKGKKKKDLDEEDEEMDNSEEEF